MDIRTAERVARETWERSGGDPLDWVAWFAGTIFGMMHNPLVWIVLLLALAIRGSGGGWPIVVAFIAAMFAVHLWVVADNLSYAGLTLQSDRVANLALFWSAFFLIFMSLAVYLLRITGLGREPKLHKQG